MKTSPLDELYEAMRGLIRDWGGLPDGVSVKVRDAETFRWMVNRYLAPVNWRTPPGAAGFSGPIGTLYGLPVIADPFLPAARLRLTSMDGKTLRDIPLANEADRRADLARRLRDLLRFLEDDGR